MEEENIFEDYKAAARFVEKVAVTQEDLTVLYRNGESEAHPFSTFKKVTVITTDQGPLVDDVFWLILCDTILMIAQGTPGEDKLLQRLQELPGFSNEQVIKAISCSDNAAFPVWEKPE